MALNVSDMLHPSDSNQVDLQSVPLFHRLFQTWSMLGRQQDAAEFAGFLVKSLNPERFQFLWERRVHAENDFRIHDFCSEFQPLLLQFQMLQRPLIFAWRT